MTASACRTSIALGSRLWVVSLGLLGVIGCGPAGHGAASPQRRVGSSAPSIAARPPRNSGSTGEACSPPCRGTCENGRCITTLATGQDFPSGIAVDDKRVYWTNLGGDTVMDVATDGGIPETLASGFSSPRGLAIDANDAYVTDDGGGENRGVVVKVPLHGATPTTLAAGQASPFAVTVDTTSVYWTNRKGGTIVKAPIGGGTLATIATNQVQPVAIRVDSSWVYWLARGAIVKAPLAGGTTTTLFSPVGHHDIEFIVHDAWRDPDAQFGFDLSSRGPCWVDDNAILCVEPTGGRPRWLAVGRREWDPLHYFAEEPKALAVDGDTAYFSYGVWLEQRGAIVEPAGISVNEVPLEGGRVTTLAEVSGAPNSHAPRGIAVDETGIYWADFLAGTIMKVSPR